MILAQAQQVTNAGAPSFYYVAALIISGVAVVIAVANFMYTQRKNDAREVAKWRRDTLSKTVVEYIDNTERIDDLVYNYMINPDYDLDFSLSQDSWNEAVGKLDAGARMMEICDSSELAELADANKQRLLDNFFAMKHGERKHAESKPTEWGVEKLRTLKGFTRPNIEEFQIVLKREIGITKPNRSLNDRMNKLKILLMVSSS